MAPRNYGQYCGIARAMEIVGERWAMLIVRDLILAPKRFVDLKRGLPRIPTNILSARLKELEQYGVVQRRVLPRPASAVVYELTEYGRDLEDILLRFGRWGARSLDVPGSEDIMTPDALVLALRATFQPEAAAGASGGFEVRVGPLVVHARVANGVVTTAEGELPDADLIMEVRGPLKPLLARELSPADALAGGLLLIDGDAVWLERFVEWFRLEPTPVPA